MKNFLQMAEKGKCFGGMARMFTKIKELSEDQDNENLLVLNAGDYFTGTSICSYCLTVCTSTLINE